MKPTKTISPQNWMQTPEIKAVMHALGEGSALFVGGCVRNILLGESVADIDIATKHTPETVIEKLTAAKIKTIPTGIDHGTITAVTNKQKFEITTLRIDQKTDGRHAQVEFSDDWIEDAKRRDFTINTLLMDLNGNIFDSTGQGIADLEQRKIIFVGEPQKRIEEDYLRILRFFRFHALYGEGFPDQAALKACQAASTNIPTLSIERITQEFFKILMVENPSDVLKLMQKTNVLSQIVPLPPSRGKAEMGVQDFKAISTLSQLQETHTLQSLSSRLIILAERNPQTIAAYDQTLLIPKALKKEITAIAKILTFPNLTTDQSLKIALYKHGRIATAQAYLIQCTQNKIKNTETPTALNIIQNWPIPTLPINGNDLIAQGYKAGKELGEELERLEEEWIANGFKSLIK